MNLSEVNIINILIKKLKHIAIWNKLKYRSFYETVSDNIISNQTFHLRRRMLSIDASQIF